MMQQRRLRRNLRPSLPTTLALVRTIATCARLLIDVITMK